MSSPRRPSEGLIYCPKNLEERNFWGYGVLVATRVPVPVLFNLNNIPQMCGLTKWEPNWSPGEHPDLKGCVSAGVWGTNGE